MSNTAIFIFIRGIPGSGKTTLAKKLANRPFTVRHYEADMWMKDEDGNYKFDPAKLKDCHEKCFDHFKESLMQGFAVIVSNTFVKRWEIAPYIDHCKNNRIRYVVIRCIGDFGNIHGVPPEKVFDMKMKFEGLKMPELMYDGSDESFEYITLAISEARYTP